MYKIVNQSKYIKKGTIWVLLEEGPSSRNNSWITINQIGNEYPEFIDKISDVLFDSIYTESVKNYARSILTFLELFQWVSWKQFDSIMRICATKDEYFKSLKDGTQMVKYKGILTVKRNNVSFTVSEPHLRMVRPTEFDVRSDKSIDKLHLKLFGSPPRFQECEEYGMNVEYRRDGSRYFALPTGRESIGDFIHFGVNFKGLRI
jgi:hypothetical protein